MIYLTLLSTTCVKIHQITYVIFETISHFSRHNSSVFFSSNITYFLQKQPIKVRIFRFPLLWLKFTKFLMSFFKQKVSFSSKFESFFSVMRHNSSVLFHPYLYMLFTKEAHQSSNFQFSTAPLKIKQYPLVIFQTKSQFSFKFCITLQCHDIYRH